MNTKLKVMLLTAVLCLATSLSGCKDDSATSHKMDHAERLLEEYPDSALSILDDINATLLSGTESQARYSLLKSMALDKNYIDTTSFDVLQPAIDYYLKEGLPDERLRTYYYQGRIFQNRGDFNHAMLSYLNGKDLYEEITDTLTYARLLVAQGALYISIYKIDEYVENNLLAESLYAKIGKKQQVASCLARTLNGCIIEDNKLRADSIKAQCEYFINKNPDYMDRILPDIIAYTIYFGTKEEISDIINRHGDGMKSSPDTGLDLVAAYIKIGEYDKAKSLIDSLKSDNMSFAESMKYLSIKGELCDKIKDYHGALETYREYARNMDELHNETTSYDLMFTRQQYKLEVQNLKEVHNKDKIIILCLAGAVLLLIIIGLGYHSYRTNQIRRIQAEKGKAEAERERDNLSEENTNLEMEKRDVELDRNRQKSAVAKLKQQLETLQAECDGLKIVLNKNRTLNMEVQNSIKERIEILNTVIASEITANNSFSKKFNTWIKKAFADKDKFMDNTRLAFTASHPHFIAAMEEHHLTRKEINISCLYAMGLRGKEVGEYTQIKGHYNISCAIRKKLGISDNSNIGIKLRNLMKSP